MSGLKNHITIAPSSEKTPDIAPSQPESPATISHPSHVKKPLFDFIRQGEPQTFVFKVSCNKTTRYSVAFVLREGVNEGVNGGVARTFGTHPIHLVAQEQGILL